MKLRILVYINLQFAGRS